MSHFSAPLFAQFAAAMDTLANTIRECPEELWGRYRDFQTFWYMAHHTIFWLDYYLEASPETFQPPRDFGMTEMDPEGKMPERVHSQEELLWWLAQCREKAREKILSLTDETAQARTDANGKDFTILELHLYNLRHVQHHAAQMNLILKFETGKATRWVGRGEGE